MRRVIAIAAAVLATASPAGADPGPALTEPRDARLAALDCSGDLRYSPRLPVLLVHGTGVTPRENWEAGYGPALLRRGHSVCTVALPQYGYPDTQRTVEYVVTAIREVQRRSARKISILGHSQGGFQPMFALRIWPDLAAGVDDFIGLAGVYDNGSLFDCTGGCVASFTQMRHGSALLAQLAARPMPAGPSYTTIGTLRDETVTPQPKANEFPGARAIQVQDVCPGRSSPIGMDHIVMAADAVAYELVLDALGHPGPADPERIARSVCPQLYYGSFNFVTFAPLAPGALTRAGPTTKTEPPLRCFLQAACADLDARGRLLASATLVRGRLRVHAQAPGTLRIVLRGPGTARRKRIRSVRLAIGERVVNVATRTLARGRYRLTLEGRPDGYDVALVERTLALRVRR